MTTTTFEENNETFTEFDYYGVIVMKRDSDNYINGTVLSKKYRKTFYEFKRGKRWDDMVEHYRMNIIPEDEREKFEGAYILKKDYSKARGMYIHGDFLHFLLEYLDLNYAFKILQKTKE